MKSPRFPARILIGLAAVGLLQWSCAALTQGLGSNPATTETQTAQTPSPVPSTCQSSFFPVKSGATWTYTGQFSNESYTRVFSISNISNDSFQGRTQIKDASGNTLVDTTDAWQCTNEGLLEPGGPLGATLQSAAGGGTVKTLSTSGMTIPAQIKPGDKWAQVSQLQFTTPDKTDESTLTYDFTASDVEQVNVPAGSFSAMKIQVHASTQAVLSGQTVNVTVSGFEWFSPGVGHVKSSETVYAFGLPFASESGELQSYNIP